MAAPEHFFIVTA